MSDQPVKRSLETKRHMLQRWHCAQTNMDDLAIMIHCHELRGRKLEAENHRLDMDAETYKQRMDTLEQRCAELEAEVRRWKHCTWEHRRALRGEMRDAAADIIDQWKDGYGKRDVDIMRERNTELEGERDALKMEAGQAAVIMAEQAATIERLRRLLARVPEAHIHVGDQLRKAIAAELAKEK